MLLLIPLLARLRFAAYFITFCVLADNLILIPAVGEFIDILIIATAIRFDCRVVVILIERSSNMQGPTMTQMLFDEVTADKYWIIRGNLGHGLGRASVSNPPYCFAPFIM
jgi:hypothetical protein